LLNLRDTKNGWDRCVPLTRPATEILIRYLESGRPLLQGPRTGTGLWLTYHHKILTRDALVNLAGRFSARLGFKFTMHSLRHACATHLLEGGAHIRHIAELLGHSDLQSTSHYAKARVVELSRVHRQTHPRG
jgi:site-specific recombinase XerD